MDYTKLKEGTKLLTKDGPGTFKRYKSGNFNSQNVQVQLDGKADLKWFKEKDIYDII